MKIKEHTTFNVDQDYIWLNDELAENIFVNGIKLSSPLKMTYGDFDVYKWDNVYGVFKSNSLYAFMGVTKIFGSVWQMKKFERDDSKNVKDMAAALFHYLILDLKMAIMSDIIMTPDANRFWKSQISRETIPIFIFDVETNETYNPNEVGQLSKTIPKVIIQDPIKDNMGLDINEHNKKIVRNENITGSYHRWFWLAMNFGREASHYLKESIEKYNWPKKNLMFGEQKYPNKIR